MKGIRHDKEKNKKMEKKVKQKKVKIIQEGRNRTVVIILWIILISSVIFGVYKNFTAIDKHTVHEKEVIQEKVTDTNAVENFVLSYAEVYFTWKPDKETLDERLEQLKDYTNEELQKISEESIQEDIPTISSVEEAKIWEIEKTSKKEYRVVFSVTQKIREGEKKESYRSFYETRVHKDASGSMVILQNPTICGAYEKSGYSEKTVTNDGSVDSNEQMEIEEFLVTFFRLYPTADEKELSYYAKEDTLKPIRQESGVYVLSEVELVSAVKEKKNVKVQVNVKYLDQETKLIQISQYDLLLEKDDNWMIVK